MSELTEGDQLAMSLGRGANCCASPAWRGRLCDVHQSWGDGYDEANDKAADRIEELEAALLRSAVDYNDFDDGSGGYWRCSVCRATVLIGQPKSKLKHKSDCLVRALGDNDE